MLLIPTEKQLKEMKEKSYGRVGGTLAKRFNKGRKRVSVKILNKYNIEITEEQKIFIKLNLTEEQQEKIQAERLLYTIRKKKYD